jgi:hypothetical protein
MRRAGDLTHEQLIHLVNTIQEILYEDIDEEGKSFWNPEKEWECCDALQWIACALDDVRLAPLYEYKRDHDTTQG